MADGRTGNKFPDTESVNQSQKRFKYQCYFHLDELKGTF